VFLGGKKGKAEKLSARTYRNGSAEILSCTYAGKSLEIELKKL
jgi:hypothetical protein